jgi:subfamily B ATP-binding cassette protein HlyB/CyaB
MTEGASDTTPDPGLFLLVGLLGFNGIGADADQLRHRLGTDRIGVPEMLRCARELGLKARSLKTRWKRLVITPVLRDGSFLLLGKATDEGTIVQVPGVPRPRLMTRAEFEAAWSGELVLMTRRAGLVELSRRFDIRWFLAAMYKYRYVLARVLVASFFLQLFALVSPLFFQVVIDKVLVNRSVRTLDGWLWRHLDRNTTTSCCHPRYPATRMIGFQP